MEKKYVVGLGEALWDVLPEGKKLGGAPANFAFHAGQFGLNSIAVSALGEDKLADETVQQLEEKGLQYCMPRVPYPTGTVQVKLDDESRYTVNILPRVLTPSSRLNRSLLNSFGNLSKYSFASSLLESMSRFNVNTACDLPVPYAPCSQIDRCVPSPANDLIVVLRKLTNDSCG